MSDRRHAFAPVIDALYAHQERQINKYECATCGDFKLGSELDDFLIRDSGTEDWWLICKPCQAKKRHELLR